MRNTLIRATARADKKYLLYLDILGFKELAKDSRKVRRLYGVIDSLNAHRHPDFRTIVFSDTILVYNDASPRKTEEHDYIVWYAIEFAEDLHHRLTGLDIYFRGVLLYGNFSHYKLDNIECFFGSALIDAYEREKRIPCLGLFIDDSCIAHNKYFPTARYSDDLHFVYLNRDIERLQNLTDGHFPVNAGLDLSDDFQYLTWQVTFLRAIWIGMRNSADAHVRAKFLCAWDFYRRRYSTLLDALERSKFDMSAISTRHNWQGQRKSMMRDIAHFRASGVPSSGTKQSTK